MSTENELEIRSKIQEISEEAQRILDKNKNNTIHHDSDRFFKLVDELEHVNHTRTAPRINKKISEFVNYCTNSAETRYKYEDILKTTQQFLNDVKPQ